MYKTQIAIFFTFLFLAVITAPTIIVAIDDSINISLFYDFSDEEEKEKQKEKDKTLEIIISEDSKNIDSIDFKNNSSLEYYYKKYTKPHLNLVLPPPERNIL